MKAWIRDRV